MQLSDADIHYWLAACRLPGIGPVRLKQWLETFGELKNLLTASSGDLRSLGITESQINILKNIDWQQVESDWQWCSQSGCQIITYKESAYYPKLLQELHGAPLVLFVQGDVALLSQPQLAMVGSRNPSPVGIKLAEHFASALVQANLVITSGLALGIDAASHRGALAAQGKTIAVCGTGLKNVYPASHCKLAENILNQGGVMLSEFSPDTPPKAQHFPIRNRLISGLSLGVFVIEAALRSGSLITARFAVEQGREVFALPGSIHNPLAKGCHYLIRQGAKLVETAEDILEELGALKHIMTQEVKRPDQNEAHPLLAQMGYEITPLDAIIMRSGLTAAEVSSMLLLLELEGYVKIVPGGYLRMQ